MSRRFSNRIGAPAAVRLLALLALILPAGKSSGWGKDGHYIVLRAALDSLPPEAKRPFSGNRRFIDRWMMEPDKHHTVPAQSARHWIDIERTSPEYIPELRAALAAAFQDSEYADEEARKVAAEVDSVFFSRRPLPWNEEKIGALFLALPVDFPAFRERYGRLVSLMGTVIYQPARYTSALSRAMDSQDRYDLARYAGYLAHYAADACVPFHVTANYRGQHSGNLIFSDRERGTVHARFEDGFVHAHAKDLGAKLKPLRTVPRPIPPDQIARRVAACARAAYGQLDGLLEADRICCARADPRRRWNRYVREVTPFFEPVALRQLAAAADLLAGLILSAHLSGISDDPADSGTMEAP